MSGMLVNGAKVSELRVGWLRLLTADTFALLGHVSHNSDVALLTPGGAPRVLDEPVVSLALSSLTNKEDTVIEAGSAEVLDNTTKVELESKRGTIDGNRNWSFSKSSGEGLWVLWGDILVAREHVNGTLGIARSISTLIWVVRLSVHHVSLGVIEGVVHETTIAALVALLLGAVNELLLRERWELTVLLEVGTLHGTGGRESPAGTALSLVLDWGDGTFLSPVDAVVLHVSSTVVSVVFTSVVFTSVVFTSVVFTSVVFSALVIWLLDVVLETEKSLVLLLSPVRHVVDAPDGIIWVLLVVIIDLLEALIEDLESEHVLLLSAVHLVVLSNVVVEGVESGLVDLKGGGGTGDGKNCGLFHFRLNNYKTIKTPG